MEQDRPRVMIRAFFESAWGDKYFLMAGWVGHVEAWQRFSDEWSDTLKARHSIDYFSHYEAKTQTGQFDGWTTQKIDKKIIALVDVICRHDFYGVITALNLKTFNSVYDKSVLARRQIKSIFKLAYPYCWCFHEVVATVLQWQLEHIKSQERVDFVFDKQTGLFDESASFYREFRQSFPPAMKAIAGTVTEANDKQVVALQAADLLVGQGVSNLRLGQPEQPLKTLIQHHEILQTTAYLPDMEGFSRLVEALNVVWSTKVLSEIKTKRDPT